MMIINGKKFTKIKLLGKGKGGYSYLVTDGTNYYVCKQIHHEPCLYYQFGNKLEAELHDYNVLKRLGLTIPALIDVDHQQEIILKEYINGNTIYDLIVQNEDVSVFIKQVRKMCDILYAHHLNIDYFPTNFVVQEGILYYIDYECNSYMEEWNFENWGIQYWSKTEQFMNYWNEQQRK